MTLDGISRQLQLPHLPHLPENTPFPISLPHRGQALSESAAAASGARLDDVPSLQCWTGGHIAIAAVALVCLIVYHSAAVLGAPVWQRRDSRLQLVLKPTFLILSLEVKFALAIVANFFSQVPCRGGEDGIAMAMWVFCVVAC